MNADPYWKLRPWAATAPEDRCGCTEVEGLYLAYKLSANPIHCLACDGEVAPERLQLDLARVDALAAWNRVYGALYALWLDSGDYETWARDRLADRDGDVTRKGLALCSSLAGDRPAYYLWFYEGDGDRPGRCPLCATALTTLPASRRSGCRSCHVLF